MKSGTPRLVGRGRLGSQRRPDLELPDGPSLAELLVEARERKGVDHFRAERETKIRARYLVALETGEYRELPGAVYTKGFLRNYALYLGLDPEEVLERFHRERPESGPATPAIVVPKAITAPRQGLTITPGLIAAALLTLGVAAFAVYLGLQLFRFAKPPTIAVTDPPIAVLAVEEGTSTYTLRGTASAGASIAVVTPGRDPIRGTADGDGLWEIEVELRRGQNQFRVSATDPDTGKMAEAVSPIYINVPFPVVEAPTLTLDQPTDTAEYQNGAITISGTTTNAASVTISARYLGPVPWQGSPAASGPRPSGSAKPSAAPSPEPVTVTPEDDGSFSSSLELTTGRWEVTVTASGAAAKSVTLSRTVSVVYKGVNLVVTIRGGKAWLKVWVDGQVDPQLGSAGRVVGNGKTYTFTGTESIEIRSGNPEVTYYTLNGTDLGNLGGSASPVTWLFRPPDPPVKTNRAR